MHNTPTHPPTHTHTHTHDVKNTQTVKPLQATHTQTEIHKEIMASKESLEHHSITTTEDSSKINKKNTTASEELLEISKETVASKESSEHHNTTS